MCHTARLGDNILEQGSASLNIDTILPGKWLRDAWSFPLQTEETCGPYRESSVMSHKTNLSRERAKEGGGTPEV